jgi:uncharacterized protein (TIGR00369 family)
MQNREHWQKLERMYLSAPTNEYYRPTIHITEGACEIQVAAREDFHHAAHAVHGSVYFKLLDDAGFFAANSVVEDVFVLTSVFTIHLLRPAAEGNLTAKGRLVNGGARQFLADAQLFDDAGKLIAHGVGTYVRSKIALTPELGY